MQWWIYALLAIALIGCGFVVRARRGRDSKEDQELNRRIDERVERLDLTRRNHDKDS